MILILANAGDVWAVPVEQELLRRGQLICRVDVETILDGVSLNWLLDDGGHRSPVLIGTGGGREIPLLNLRSILLRADVGRLTVAPGLFSQADQTYVERELSATWYGWLHAQSCAVVNLPVFGRGGSLAGTSVEFHHAAMQVGFATVSTTVISDIHRAHEWFETHNRDARVWSVGWRDNASYLRGVEGRGRLSELIEAGPVAMQPIPQGARVHAFVAGEAVIGATWRTAVRDARLQPSVLDHATLSPEVARRCRQMAYERQLIFAELELVQGIDGTISCLSVSGDPLYARCSDPLRKALVIQLSTLLERAKENGTCDFTVRSDYRSNRGESLDASCRQVG